MEEKSTREIIQEAVKTGKPIADLIGKGLSENYTQDQLIAAYLRGKCSEQYLATRLNVSLLETRQLVKEYQNCLTCTFCDTSTGVDEMTDEKGETFGFCGWCYAHVLRVLVPKDVEPLRKSARKWRLGEGR